MIFYKNPLAYPEKEAEFLLRRFGTATRATLYADWVLTHLAVNTDTRRFWCEVIIILGKEG
jgi:hypothetical protein